MAEYDILGEYVEALEDAISAGKEVVVEVRDRSTFERKVVRAIIARSAVELPAGDKLLVRNLVEDVQDVWAIQIVEELDPDEVEIRPQSDFRRWSAER